MSSSPHSSCCPPPPPWLLPFQYWADIKSCDFIVVPDTFLRVPPAQPQSWCKDFTGQFFGVDIFLSFLQGWILSKYFLPVFRKYLDGEKCSLCTIHIFPPKLYFLGRHSSGNRLLWKIYYLALVMNQRSEFGVEVHLMPLLSGLVYIPELSPWSVTTVASCCLEESLALS